MLSSLSKNVTHLNKHAIVHHIILLFAYFNGAAVITYILHCTYIPSLLSSVWIDNLMLHGILSMRNYIVYVVCKLCTIFVEFLLVETWSGNCDIHYLALKHYPGWYDIHHYLSNFKIYYTTKCNIYYIWCSIIVYLQEQFHTASPWWASARSRGRRLLWRKTSIALKLVSIQGIYPAI